MATCTGVHPASAAFTLIGDLSGPTSTLTVNCDAVIDLAGHDLTVQNIIIGSGKRLEVLDATLIDPGELFANAGSIDGVAGIQNTGATLVVGGHATVRAWSRSDAAGVGGVDGEDGGTVLVKDSATLDAWSMYLDGAGVGGGSGGHGGTTVIEDNGRLIARSTSDAAAVGGGRGGNGGITTLYDNAIVLATGGLYGAGVGGGFDGDGGTTTLYDNASMTATGGGGAGVGGGGYGGHGGLTTLNDTSTLIATGEDDGAGVGGSRWGNGGETIVHDDAELTAIAKGNGAGIGGGNEGDGGVTTLDGNATVTATGGTGGAGIGGGYQGAGGTTDLGGSAHVTAAGGAYLDGTTLRGGAGIGSGGDSPSSAGTTTISAHANVTTEGKDGGAGIGGGADVDGHSTTIEDNAIVAATGGDGAAGIGGGFDGDGADTTVEDEAIVTATGGDGGAGIGGGSESDGGTTVIHGGTVTAIPDAGDELWSPASPDAVGAGEGNSDHAELRVLGGTLVLPSGVQRVHAASTIATPPVFAVGSAGKVTGDLSDPTKSAQLAGDGILDNRGVLTLPTGMVGTTLVSTHHYRITFDLNDGGVGTPPDPVTVYAPTFNEGARDFPTAPTRVGYTFEGWDTAPNGSGDAITATSTLPGSSTTGAAVPVTAYAIWTADPTPPPPTLPVPTPTLTNTTSSDRSTDDPQVGDQLQIAAPNAALTYLWQRVDPDTGVASDAAAGTDYTLIPADLGHRIQVTASAARLPYSGSATVTTGEVQAAPLPGPGLTVTGAPRIGQTLTAIATLPDIAGLTATWSWHTRAPGADDWMAAPNAGDSADYVPTAEAVGHDVRVTLTLTAPGHLDHTETATTGPVVDRPALTKARAPRVGQPVRVAAPLPGTTHTYQWQRTRTGADATGAGASKWIDIPDATGRAYTPEPGDLKRRLRVQVTTSAPGHQPHAATTRATKRVKKGVLPKPEKAIEIRGKQRVNKTLRLTAIGSYRKQLPDGAKISFAWYADDEAIPRATRPKLKVRRPLVDAKLHATVTVRAPGYRVRTVAVAS